MSRFLEDLKKQDDPLIIQVAKYLLTREDIKDNLNKENKSLEEMNKYIMSEVYKMYTKKKGKKNGGIGIEDEDVYNMAVHYYDEDDIKIDEIKDATVKSSNKEVSKTKNTNTSILKKAKKKDKVSSNQLSMLEMLGITDEDLQISN